PAGRPRVAAHADVAGALADVSLNRQHRPDVLLLRLGIATPGGGFSRDFSWPSQHRDANDDHVVVQVAAVPRGIRGGPDQAAPRQVLARPDVSVLPPRDPA